MKIFVIRDEAALKLVIGYLFYYEKSDTFSIELSPEIEETEAPLFLASFIKRGIYTVDPEWSARWVQQRIIPTDRQNIGMILRDNGLKEYQPCRLLMLCGGRCAQDDCSVMPINENQLPEWMAERKKRKLELAVPMKEQEIFLIFCDGSVRKADLKNELSNKRRFQILLSRPELFRSVRLLPGGNGITWGEGIFLMAETLYSKGKKIGINKEEFRIILKGSILDTADVCRELQCSRQYVNRLVQMQELSCLKESGNNRLYERREVEMLKE